MAISNNHRGVLEQIAAFIGFGAIYEHPRSSSNAKIGYVWQALGFRIDPVLRNMHPFLIVKKAQAECALSFIERRKRERTRPFTDEDYAHVAEMRALNDRAPGKGTPIQPIPKPRARAAWGAIANHEL